MKKVILFKVIDHSCGSYECCQPDPTVIPASEWTELEDSDYEALVESIRYTYGKYLLLEATDNKSDSLDSIPSLIKKGKQLIEEENKRVLAREKKAATRKINEEKNAIARKLKKLEQLKKDLGLINDNGNRPN